MQDNSSDIDPSNTEPPDSLALDNIQSDDSQLGDLGVLTQSLGSTAEAQFTNQLTRIRSTLLVLKPLLHP